MRELRAIAADRGLKYYLHLSKPELFSLLQRKEGGGGKAKPAAVSNDQGKQSSARPSEHPNDVAADHGDRSAKAAPSDPKATRSSERLSSKKIKRKADEERAAPAKKKAKVVANTLDPIMLAELGPHTVRRFYFGLLPARTFLEC